MIPQLPNRSSGKPALRRGRWILAVAALALVAASCATDGVGNEAETAAEAEATPAESTSASSPTNDAPSNDDGETGTTELVATAGGGQIDWNSLQGQDVVLWFWAPW